MLTAPWSKVTCLYCFGRFHLSESPRRSIAAGQKGEPDAKVGEFFGIPAPSMGKVDDPKRSLWQRMARRFAFPLSRDLDSHAVCPRCHLPLTQKTAVGELSSELFAIIGARSSGKSNYFGVLLHALERRFASEVGFTLYPENSFSVEEMKPVSSVRLYKKRYGCLYEAEPRAVEQTQGMEANLDLRVPLIYRLSFPRRGLRRLTGRSSVVDLALFDAAGEDLNDPTKVRQFYGRFLSRATGIIFLIDPSQFAGIRSRLSDELQARLPPIDHSPTEIVTEVLNVLMAKGLYQAGGKKVGMPVAFALSKCDILDGLIYAGSELRKDGSHAGGFDAEGCRRLSDEIVQWVREWDSPQLPDLAKDGFRDAAFFAVSALGALPDAKMRIPPPAYRRISDPLLWLLWKRGYIPAKPPAK